MDMEVTTGHIVILVGLSMLSENAFRGIIILLALAGLASIT
jgi:hypothetical protein